MHDKGCSAMNGVAVQHKETLLIEILLCSLDIRTSASQADSPMLTYLAELLVKQAKKELAALGGRLESECTQAED